MDFFKSGKASRHRPFSASPIPCCADAERSTAAGALFAAAVDACAAGEAAACAKQRTGTNPAIKNAVNSKQVGLVMN
jgi:hypothetical protein